MHNMIDEESSNSDKSNLDFRGYSKLVCGDYEDSNSLEHHSEPQKIMPAAVSVVVEKKKRKSYSKRINSILENGDDGD